MKRRERERERDTETQRERETEREVSMSTGKQRNKIWSKERKEMSHLTETVQHWIITCCAVNELPVNSPVSFKRLLLARGETIVKVVVLLDCTCTLAMNGERNEKRGDEGEQEKIKV